MDINAFITDNYVTIIIIAVIIVMTLIGFIAQKTGFGQKVAQRNNKDINKSDSEKVEILDENSDNQNSNNIENQEILDEIEPDFNDGELMIGDVNQNPNKTNEDLGINEDLYAPFGDSDDKKEFNPNDLKIEEVEELDDFNIIEKDEVKNDYDTEEIKIEDINVPLEDSSSNENLDIKIEEVVPEENPVIAEVESPNDKVDNQVVDEINEIVDNTFVINDATSDFKDTNDSIDKLEDNSSKTENKSKNKKNKPKSKVEQFNIEDNEVSIDDSQDLEIETTTNLKLDEINEQIKNLKLEDLDNPTVDEEITQEIKKKKKKKAISIKNVDELKKDNTTEENNSDVLEMSLPNLDDVSKKEEKVDNEEDDIWKF